MEFFTSAEEVNLTGFGIRFVYCCRVTNYFGRPVANILTPLRLRFYEAVANESGGLQSGRITLAREWLVNIAKIDEGPERAFVFYAWNFSDKFADFDIPNKATFQFVGETTRRVGSIQTNKPLMFLSPRDKD